MRDQQQLDKSIALIGMRGSGKTVVGRALAAFYNVPHIDTDDLVIQAAGKTIAEIFDAEDEAGFRNRERAMIQQLVLKPPAVISVGGGAVLDNRNVQRLRMEATGVWLTADAEVLWRRISRDPNTPLSRPSLTDHSGVEEIRQLLSARNSYYKKACTFTVDTTNKTPEQIAQEILLLC